MLFLNLLDDKVHLVFSQQRPGPLLCYHLQMSEVGLQVSKVIHPMGVVSLKSENDIDVVLKNSIHQVISSFAIIFRLHLDMRHDC